jgi:hypothetical protein
MADPQRECLQLLEAELARRQQQRAWDAAADEQATGWLVDELLAMAGRLAIPKYAELAAELSAATDMAEIEAVRLRADLSPAGVVALLLPIDPDGAARVLRNYSCRAGQLG